jgi:hypothetical protein
VTGGTLTKTRARFLSETGFCFLLHLHSLAPLNLSAKLPESGAFGEFELSSLGDTNDPFDGDCLSTCDLQVGHRLDDVDRVGKAATLKFLVQVGEGGAHAARRLFCCARHLLHKVALVFGFP